MNNPYMVCARCFTFNQASYIEDTLNGFSMQRTNFPFVCVIVDDASTDGEQNVIMKYVEDHFALKDETTIRNEETDDYVMLYAQHANNKNCYFAVYLLKYNHYSIKKSKIGYLTEWIDTSKYYALCEGDDYWIDPYKLQKQVEIFANDDNVGLCYTYSRLFIQSENCYKEEIIGVGGPCDFESLLLNEPQMTLTSLFRLDLYRSYHEEIAPNMKDWLMGDTPLWLYLSIHSKVVLLDQVTAVYRFLPESASHSRNIEKKLMFNKSALDIRLFFCEKYDKSRTDLVNSIYDVYYRSNMQDTYSQLLFGLFWKNLIKVKNKNCNDYILLAKLIIKKSFVFNKKKKYDTI